MRLVATDVNVDIIYIAGAGGVAIVAKRGRISPGGEIAESAQSKKNSIKKKIN